MAILTTGEFIIGQHNYARHCSPVVDGETMRHGLIPRDYATHPRGCYEGILAIDVPLVPMGEWAARAASKVAELSQLSDIRNIGNSGQPIPSRDQNGRGYCWQHSGVSVMLVTRAKYNLPFADLSAYGPACLGKDYRDEGGWGAAGVDWLMKYGCPTSKTWPQRSVSRSNDTPAMRAEALLYRIVEEWADLQAAQYDRNLAWEQVVSLLLSDVAVVGDFNWWSHSVALLDLVNAVSERMNSRDQDSGKLLQLADFELAWDINNPITRGFGVRILNSWGDGWSQNGTGILTGNHAIPDGSVAPRTVTLAVAA